MFDLIYCDPPWNYNQRAVWTETRFGGGVSAQYPTMTEDRLFGLKDLIHQIANKDCALLLWAVWPKMDVAIDLIRAWEFKFSSRAFTWIKTYPKSGTPFRGPGAGVSSNDEVVILSYRGQFPHPAHKLADGIVYEDEQFQVPHEWDDPVVQLPHPRFPSDYEDEAKRGKIIHSAKPEEVRKRIERLWPTYRKIELFARVRTPGWTSVGLDLSGMDIYDELEALVDRQQKPSEMTAGNYYQMLEIQDLIKQLTRTGVDPERILETICPQVN